jgi:hypothetical protein
MPTTTTGKASELITFSRTSNATLVDSDGRIKWAPHNLLLASEQFDAASWGKTSTTPTANAVAAPNGTTTADTLTASGANGTTLQSYTSLGVSYTFGIWLKRKTGTGNIQIAADSGTYTTVTITSDWALYTVTQTPAAGTISAGIRIVTSADAVEAWGAHLYRSDLGGMKANTSAYPTYNPTTPKNLLGYTEDWSNAAWVKSSGITTITANAVAAPNGLLYADLMTNGTGDAYAYQSVSLVAGTTYTFSLYAKAASPSSFSAALQIYNASDTGTPATISVTSEWQRFSLTKTVTVTGTYLVIIGGSIGGVDTLSGDNIYLWGAQLSDSASLDTYVPNYGAAPTAAAYYGPRLDADPVTLAAKGLLVEEQRTNGLGYSNDFGNAGWAKAAAGSGVTPVVTGGFTDPNGGSTAWRIQLNAGSNGSGDYSFLRQTHGLADPFARSIWVKSNTGSPQTVTLVAPSPSRKVTVPTTWTRIEQIEPGPGAAQFDISVGGTAATPATADILVWNAQAETGSFATSYIPTGAATATRDADVASVSTQAFPYSATEGTLVASGDFVGVVDTPAAGFVAMTDGVPTGSPSLSYSVLFKNTTLAVSGRRSTVGTATNITVANTTAANTVIKMGAAYSVNGTDALSVNGGTVATQAGVTSAYTDTIMRIGNFGVNPAFINGHIRQITYIPRRLANAELQTRTS